MWVLRRHYPQRLNALLGLILITLCIYVFKRDRIPLEISSPVVHISNIVKTPELLIKLTNASIVVKTPQPSKNYFHAKLDLSKNTAICHENDHLILYIFNLKEFQTERSRTFNMGVKTSRRLFCIYSWSTIEGYC